MSQTNNLQNIRTILWICVALALAAFGAVYLGNVKQAQNTNSALVITPIDKDAFKLTAHDGSEFSSESLTGTPYMVFFGFTHCPDVCPTTLLEVTNNLAELGDKSDKLKVLFVTVDPERDTKEVLHEYLKAFDPRIIGLTGSTDEIARVAKLYFASYKKVPGNNGNYTMDHTAAVLLFDSNGKLTSTLNWQEPAKTRKKKLENLLSR